MSAHPHRLSQYQDGVVWVEYCKVCSGEGDQLKLPCSGKYVDKKPSHPNVDRQDVKLATKRLQGSLDKGDTISLDELRNILDKAKEPS